MAKLKISENQYIGTKELNRLIQFLDQDGFREIFLKSSSEFGIFQTDEENFPNFLVSQGANVGTIKHNEGYAIDSLGEIIYKPSTDNIAVPNDNTFRKVKISFQSSPIEVGTVDIDANGNLTGTGTKFTEVLRGLPGNFVSKLRFDGAVDNTSEYYVAEVIDDTNAILQGNFIAETGLKLVVIGTFDSNTPPLSADKDIFQYNSCLFELVADNVTATSGLEFFIARVRNNAGSITIQDLRSRNLYKNSFQSKQERIELTPNPLIGVESIKNNNPKSPKDRNIVRVGFGFRSSNWSYNPSLNRITISSGEGGKYITVSDFQDGDFDGWRIYSSDGKYSIIKTSFKQGAQINIDLNSSDYLSFESIENISIVPNADNVILHFSPDPSQNYPNAEQAFSFPVRDGFADCQVLVFDNTANYILSYYYQKGSRYTKEAIIPSNSIGYYNEVSFNSNGTLKSEIDRVRVPYTASSLVGFISLQLAGNSYARVVEQFFIGDFLGVTRTSLDNLDPIFTLTVGVDRQTQIYEGTIALNTDHYINLSEDDAQNGNEFFLKFENNITLGSNSLQVVTNFNNPGDPGTILFTFDAFWVARALKKNLILRCTHDGSNWYVFPDAAFESVREIQGDLTINSGSDPSALRIITTSGNGYIEFINSNQINSRAGYIGYPTLSNNVLYLKNDNNIDGNIYIVAGDGEVGGGDVRLFGDAVRKGNTVIVNSDNKVPYSVLEIADGQIPGAKLADDSITASKMTANSVGPTALSDNSVDTGAIVNGAVTVAKMAANSVDSAQYVDGSIDNIHLANDAVNGSKIADNSIDSEHYVDGSIDTVHIGNDQVTSVKVDNSVSSAGLSGFSNWNSLTKPGIYTRLNVADTNSPGAGSWIIFVTAGVVGGIGDTTQVAISLGGATFGGDIRTRTFALGSWGAWSLINTGDHT